MDFSPHIKTLMHDAAQQKEKILVNQINELVSRGLLVIEQGEMQFVRLEHEEKIEMRQNCRIVLKDQEYIEKLEAQVDRLKKVMNQLGIVLQDANEESPE